MTRRADVCSRLISDVPDDVLLELVERRRAATKGPIQYSGGAHTAGSTASIYAGKVLIALVPHREGCNADAEYLVLAAAVAYALALEELERRGVTLPEA